MTTGPESPERDPALERAWRAHSREAPPPELDRAILAAAHRAVGSGPAEVAPGREANRPQRWWMPLAAAATIGAVAVGILQMSPRDESIVAPTERIAAVAPQRELAKAKPAEAPGAPASSAESKLRALPVPSSAPAANEAAAARKQDAQRLPPLPAAAVPAAPPPPAAPAPPAAPPPATAVARDAPSGVGKLALRAPDPFPGAQAPRKAESAEMTAAAPAADRAATAAVAQASRAEPAAAPAPPVAEDKRELARKDLAEADRQLGAAAAPSAPASAVAAAPSAPASAGAAAPRAAPAPPAAGMRARENAFASDASREQAAPVPPALVKRAAPAEDARTKARDPEAWIAQIRKLRDEGRTAEAIRELRDFREFVPDAERRIPPDLRELAAVRP